MTITITGQDLSIEQIANVARDNEKVEIASSAIEKIIACRELVEEKIASGEIMYGINTGIG